MHFAGTLREDGGRGGEELARAETAEAIGVGERAVVANDALIKMIEENKE